MPKTQYQYLTFVKEGQTGKTTIWKCCNTRSGTELGIVKWHPDWRQYCYFPTIQAVYSAGCLRDIASFTEELRKEETAQPVNITKEHKQAVNMIAQSVSETNHENTM